jgi:hypothetical protein
MHLAFGPEFRQEWAHYRFRFCCEDCTYMDRQRDRCVHGWPDEEHRLRFYEDILCRELIFCKEFEVI